MAAGGRTEPLANPTRSEFEVPHSMRVPSKLPLLVVVSLLVMLALAVPAAAKTPNGQGLITAPQTGISSLSCTEDPSIQAEDVLFPRGGGLATWVVGGEMYLLWSIEVDGYSMTFGNKHGLSDETITCTFVQSGPGFEVSGTVVLVQVP